MHRRLFSAATQTMQRTQRTEAKAPIPSVYPAGKRRYLCASALNPGARQEGP